MGDKIVEVLSFHPFTLFALLLWMYTYKCECVCVRYYSLNSHFVYTFSFSFLSFTLSPACVCVFVYRRSSFDFFLCLIKQSRTSEHKAIEEKNSRAMQIMCKIGMKLYTHTHRNRIARNTWKEGNGGARKRNIDKLP